MEKRTKEIIGFLSLTILSVIIFVSVFLGSLLLIGLAVLFLLTHVQLEFPQITFNFLDSIFIIITILIIPFYIAIKVHRIVPIPKNPFNKKRTTKEKKR